MNTKDQWKKYWLFKDDKISKYLARYGKIWREDPNKRTGWLDWYQRNINDH